ncbi:hypothetical protein GCM10020367_55440 [Streptomyces sannanensis]|uniref:Uncharacterized protein n=1 Tax=Streptomyces sannanensis TaxID=285536 RepID=A0ABP6SIQ5_9ACTN
MIRWSGRWRRACLVWERAAKVRVRGQVMVPGLMSERLAPDANRSILHVRCNENATWFREGIVSTQTIGFAVSDADRADLDELVEYFGGGNRSAYLRATIKIMKSVKLAEELREVQAYGEQKLAEQGASLADVTAITRRVLKGRE